MKYRKLRIAWSVVWGLLAAMLCALWIRSYWQLDYINKCDRSSVTTTVGSQWGVIYIARFNDTNIYGGSLPRSHGWEYGTHESYVLDRATWIRNPNGFVVNLPQWSLITSLVLIALAPWTRQSRWRFSVRTLLIATTLVA